METAPTLPEFSLALKPDMNINFHQWTLLGEQRTLK
jgi:hypothetical protein